MLRDFVLPTEYRSNDQTKEKEVDETCGTNGENRNANFCWKNLKERDHLKDVRLDGRTFSPYPANVENRVSS